MIIMIIMIWMIRMTIDHVMIMMFMNDKGTKGDPEVQDDLNDDAHHEHNMVMMTMNMLMVKMTLKAPV